MNQSWLGRWLSRLTSPSGGPVGASEQEGANADALEGTNNRGALYASDHGGSADYLKALECFRRAAEAGYALSQNNLGLMFASGHGVVRSDVEACRWFRRAAEQGDAGGQFHLGNMCHPASLGQSVPEGGEARIQAYMWFSLAAAQGYLSADAACESLNFQMSITELDEARRRIAAFVPCREKLQDPTVS